MPSCVFFAASGVTNTVSMKFIPLLMCRKVAIGRTNRSANHIFDLCHSVDNRKWLPETVKCFDRVLGRILTSLRMNVIVTNIVKSISALKQVSSILGSFLWSHLRTFPEILV